jgi:S-formylglutathione hydrolase FrmB
MNGKRFACVCLTILFALCFAGGCLPTQSPTSGAALRFRVRVADGLLPHPRNGRLYVVMSADIHGGEPRFRIGKADSPSPTVARDVSGFRSKSEATVDETAFCFPLPQLAQLPAGDYTVQAVFEFNSDLKSPNAPGNLYSKPQQVKLDPKQNQEISLSLTEANPPESLPAETELIKYVKFASPLLSRFYGRSMFLRAGIILPRDYSKEPNRRYPLRVKIGGYGSRFTDVGTMMLSYHPFYQAWMADDAPRMILLHLDGAGPLGDPYQINSANHGPYGDAVTQELIPFVERTFRGIGKPSARVLDGGSTGGWVSFALQVFYPDFFNGCWSYSPDPVDFRAYQLVNIYKDTNAYTDAAGKERTSMRRRSGETALTMRNEVGSENLVGRHDSYTTGGGQWGAWNATYSPRGEDGLPVPLWNPKTGAINHSVAEQWRKYDLRWYLEKNWKTLAPKLRGKIHIWVGEADEFFLNNAVHLLDDFLSKADPPFDGTLKFGAGKGHIWVDLNERQIMEAMQARIESGK